jgi:hypothetical protein
VINARWDAGLTAAFSARAQAPGQLPARLSPPPQLWSRPGRSRFKLEPPFPWLPSEALNNCIFNVAISHIGRIRAPLIVPLDTQPAGSRRPAFCDCSREQIGGFIRLTKMGAGYLWEPAMNRDEDEYQRLSADAERQARSAKSELDRAAWLRVAQGWLSLLRKRPQSDEGSLRRPTKAEGTGQDDSQSSN